MDPRKRVNFRAIFKDNIPNDKAAFMLSDITYINFKRNNDQAALNDLLSRISANNESCNTERINMNGKEENKKKLKVIISLMIFILLFFLAKNFFWLSVPGIKAIITNTPESSKEIDIPIEKTDVYKIIIDGERIYEKELNVF